MRFLFLLHFYPNPCANTVCCENIANYFKNQGHQVDFMSIKDIGDETHEIINDSHIIRGEESEGSFIKKYGKEFSKKNWLSMFWSTLRLAWINKRLKDRIKSCTPAMLTSDWLNSSYYYNEIQKLGFHYDCLFAICGPFRMITLGRTLTKLGVADEWYPIFLDSFVHGHLVYGLEWRRRLALKILDTANHVFMVDGIMRGNLENDFNPYYHKKTTELFLPMLKPTGIPIKQTKETSQITLLYAGSFYQDIRNPGPMMEILSKLPSDCFVKIYSRSNCRDIVEDKKKLFTNGNILTERQISHTRCLSEILNSDILINLGNVTSNQMPCKILEYISFGKPIVNFYFNNKDMCLPILKKYPLCININVNDYNDTDISNLIHFVRENKGKTLSFDQATEGLVEYRLENVMKKMNDTIINKHLMKK